MLKLRQGTAGTCLGIACVLGASLSFSINDAAIKFLSGNYPLHEVVFVRAGIALILTLVIFLPLEGFRKVFWTRRPLLHLLRGSCLVLANLAFFSGIPVIPLADLTAIFFVAPLLITAFSAIFLHERVGVRRWTALFIGGLGVLLIIRPGTVDFEWALLFPLVAAIAYATVNTITRSMGISENASTMAVYIQVVFFVAATMMGLGFGDGKFANTGQPVADFIFGPWVAIAPWDFAIMAGCASAVAAGGYLITQAYRQTEAGLIAPFEYTVLVIAPFWGFMIFGEIPTLYSAIGIVLVLGSGVFVAIREAGVVVISGPQHTRT